MSLDQQTIARLAEHLETCELEARDTTKITNDYPDMDWDDAYAIQDEIRRRKIERGCRIVGLKAGLTSHAKMKQMGVQTPCFGFLADYFALPEGGECKVSELIHPKVEPEIAFVTKHALRGPGCHIGTVLAATEFIMPGIEVIDSRYRDFRFTLPDVIADNASAARWGSGPVALSPADLDLSLEACLVEVDGEVVDTATGAAVQGHPAEALALAANALGARGHRLRAGWVVLTGGMTDAVFLHPGSTVTVHFSNLGSVSVTGA